MHHTFLRQSAVRDAIDLQIFSLLSSPHKLCPKHADQLFQFLPRLHIDPCPVIVRGIFHRVAARNNMDLLALIRKGDSKSCRHRTERRHAADHRRRHPRRKHSPVNIMIGRVHTWITDRKKYKRLSLPHPCLHLGKAAILCRTKHIRILRHRKLHRADLLFFDLRYDLPHDLISITFFFLLIWQ